MGCNGRVKRKRVHIARGCVSGGGAHTHTKGAPASDIEHKLRWRRRRLHHHNRGMSTSSSAVRPRRAELYRPAAAADAACGIDCGTAPAEHPHRRPRRYALHTRRTHTHARNWRGTEKSNKPNSSAAREAIAHFSFFSSCLTGAIIRIHKHTHTHTHTHTLCTICLIQRVISLFVFVTYRLTRTRKPLLAATDRWVVIIGVRRIFLRGVPNRFSVGNVLHCIFFLV